MAILGLRDVASYQTQKFDNWRRNILYAFPDGAPLTGLMSLTDSEPTNDPDYHWHQKNLPTQRTTLTAAYLNNANTIVVLDPVIRQGHWIMNETTNELMEVIGVDSTGLILTVHRGEWGAAVADSGGVAPFDAIVVVGNINAEGGRAPQEISEDPTVFNNKTQIWRTPFSETGTLLNTPVKWDQTGTYKEKAREALQNQSIEMEKSAIWGAMAQYQDPATGKTKRTTGGILSFMPAGYKLRPANAGGAMTPDEWEGFLELIFRVVSNTANEKLALVGSGTLKVLNRMAQLIGRTEIVAGDEAFGMALTRWYTPYGTVYLKLHPLFTQHPVWRYSALILDVHNLGFRPKNGRDLDLLTNRQLPDEDLRKDEYFCEGGFEWHHCGTGATQDTAKDGTHLFLSNIKSASV